MIFHRRIWTDCVGKGKEDKKRLRSDGKEKKIKTSLVTPNVRCVRPRQDPLHVSPQRHLLPPPLAIPYPLVISEVKNTRFRVFEKNALRTEGWTDGRMDGRTDGRTDGRKDGPMDGRTDRWTDGRTHARTNGRTDPLIEMRGRI